MFFCNNSGGKGSRNVGKQPILIFLDRICDVNVV